MFNFMKWCSTANTLTTIEAPQVTIDKLFFFFFFFWGGGGGGGGIHHGVYIFSTFKSYTNRHCTTFGSSQS